MLFIERFFDLKGHGTDIRTEVLAGLTTFVTMAYIALVNPQILADAGMDRGSVFMATCLVCFFSSAFMGIYANYPFALAPGMGLNAFFAYVMVNRMGLSWQTALGAVFISGIIMLAITVSGFRKIIIKAIPVSLKHAVGAGIGLFIAFIGFKNAGIVVPNPVTLVDLGDLRDPRVLLSIFGLVLISVFMIKKIKGGIFAGVIITSLLGIPLGITEVPADLISLPPDISHTFLKLDILSALKFSLLPTITALFFADLFDTLGTFVGVASRTGMIDKEGNLRRGPQALVVDSAGTILGAILGTSNTTTYIESAAGVSEGGRTGFTAVVTALLFLMCIFFAPLALSVPASATAPALIIVGVFMSGSLLSINMKDFLEGIPAFVIVLLMPLTFSISLGLSAGFILYVILHVLTGRWKDVHWMMYLLAILFSAYFAFIR